MIDLLHKDGSLSQADANKAALEGDNLRYYSKTGEIVASFDAMEITAFGDFSQFKDALEAEMRLIPIFLARAPQVRIADEAALTALRQSA